MSWQIFERKAQRSTEPTVTISKLGRIGFNRATTRMLVNNQTQQVLLMWDSETKRVGIKAISKRDARAYTVHYGKDNAWSGFAAKTFFEHVGYDYSKTSSFPCEWNADERMLVIQLPSERMSKMPSGITIGRESPRRGRTRESHASSGA
jgi:hypothetical protein